MNRFVRFDYGEIQSRHDPEYSPEGCWSAATVALMVTVYIRPLRNYNVKKLITIL